MKAKEMGSKKAKLELLLGSHTYLPDAELARLSGYTLRGVEKKRWMYSEGKNERQVAVAA